MQTAIRKQMSNKRCPLEEQGRIFILFKATRREKKGIEMIIGVATEEEVRERERERKSRRRTCWS
jgi:hypothetical protein